jgi:hypothetical protein
MAAKIHLLDALNPVQLSDMAGVDSIGITGLAAGFASTMVTWAINL